MVEDEFSGEDEKEEGQDLLEKTSSASPKQKQLLKKQAEFEMGEKKREVEDIQEGKKRNRLDLFLRWGILILVGGGLFLLAKWLLF